MIKPSRLKLWYNRKYPYYRLCLRRFCLRGQTYEKLCQKHNRRELTYNE